MLRRILLFLFALVALSCLIEAKSWTKKLHYKKLPQSGERAASLLRERRAASSKSSEEEVNPPRFFLSAWERNKVEVLGLFLEQIAASDGNITLVGWQRVLNDDGSIKEIDTVQLVIPPRPVNVRDQFEEEDEDDEHEASFSEVKKIFEPLTKLGIPASVTVEEFSKKGEEEAVFYADKDEIYARIGGHSVYNKTVIASQQEVIDIVKNLQPTILGEPTVLRYDVDGKLIVDQSNIQPYLLGTVTNQYEAPESVILAGPEIIAKISQQYPQKEIAKQLGLEFNKVFSDYKWRVLVNPEHYYVTRDVDVTLTYDQFNLDGRNVPSYLVYGVKRSNVVTE